MKNIIVFSLIFQSISSIASGGIHPDKIREVLIKNIPKMRKCYQNELNKGLKAFDFSPSLNFVINKDGRVQKSKVTSNSTEMKEVKRTELCVNNVVKGIVFPKPLGGGNVEVNQTFNFKPKLK